MLKQIVIFYCVCDFLVLVFLFVWFKSRVAPDTPEGLIEYFLDTEAREIEYEISRLRPRLVL